MPENTIDKLDIKITSSVAEASKALTALKTHLESLQALTGNLAKMDNGGIEKLNKLTEAVERLSNVNASKLGKVISRLSSVSGIGVPGSDPNPNPNPSGGEDATKGIDKAKKKLLDFSRLGRRIRSIFEYRMIKAFFAAVANGFREGINNAYQWSKAISGSFAKSMDKISTATLYVKNSLGAAMIPILNSIAPVIDRIADGIVWVINLINQMISLLTGAANWTKALKYPKSYADAVSGASKKISKSLAPFDEINNIGSSPGGSGSGNQLDFSKMFEEVEFTDTFKSIKDLIQKNLVEIELICAGALLGVGAALVFTGAKPLLGLALMAAGAVALTKAVELNSDYISSTVGNGLKAVMAVVSGALLGVGAVLAFTGANVPLGIGLMAAGVAGMAVTLDWSMLPDNVRSVITKISYIVGVSTLAVGAMLAASGNLPMGLALLAVGAASMVVGVTLNWDTIVSYVSGVLDKIAFIVGGASLALGALLLISGNIPLGLALLGVGAVGIITGVALNWDDILGTLSTAWDNMKSTVSQKAEEIRSKVSEKWEEIKTNTSEKWDNIKSNISQKWENLKTSAGTTFGSIGSDISSAWETAKTNTLNKWDSIKTSLERKWKNLKSWWANLELPSFKVKTPHLSWTTTSASGWVADILSTLGLPTSLPKLNVDWYAKGGLFDSPSIIGVGEYANASSNPEVVAPLDRLQGMLDSGSEETNRLLELLIETLEEKNCTTVISPKEISRASERYQAKASRLRGYSV